MRKVFVVFGFISALCAVIISVTPLHNLSIIPIIISAIGALIIWYISRKTNKKTKFIQYITILTLIALGITIYKTMFSANEMGNVEDLQQKEEESIEDSIELLEDIEIDE